MKVEKPDLVRPTCIPRCYKKQVDNRLPPATLEEVIPKERAGQTHSKRCKVYDGQNMLDKLVKCTPEPRGHHVRIGKPPYTVARDHRVSIFAREILRSAHRLDVVSHVRTTRMV
ncbi:hypothetical protein GW17_00024411 [Ensete ventricosum]|nr:hypothetical protein GW17_00024411 [Ensete ventricosum]